MSSITQENITWLEVAKVSDIPQNGGACVKVEGKQIAIFNFTTRNTWYATDNLCPHKKQMILSRGLIGSKDGEPKVACPYHKKAFSLESGSCLTGEDLCIDTYPVKVEGENILLGLQK